VFKATGLQQSLQRWIARGVKYAKVSIGQKDKDVALTDEPIAVLNERSAYRDQVKVGLQAPLQSFNVCTGRARRRVKRGQRCLPTALPGTQYCWIKGIKVTSAMCDKLLPGAQEDAMIVRIGRW